MTDLIERAFSGVPRPQAAPPPLNPEQPPCPLCGASAIAGYAHASWSDLAHLCECDCERPAAYLSGLRGLWQSKNALPHYLATLPTRYHGYTAATIRRTDENAPVMDALKAGLTGNLYLFGPAGVGKTHLAVAGARRLAERGKTTRFWGMAALFAELRAASKGDMPRPELGHWDVLVLDDIDKIRPTAFVYETLYAVIEDRWANEKVTIFTAQHDPNGAAVVLTPDGSELAADPLASRMASGRVFRVTGEDGRAG